MGEGAEAEAEEALDEVVGALVEEGLEREMFLGGADVTMHAVLRRRRRFLMAQPRTRTRTRIWARAGTRPGTRWKRKTPS